MSKFKPTISDVNIINKELQFIIAGNDKYGLDKSIINGIRRTLLNDIPNIAFKTEENKKKDITVVTNTGQLHNEMLLQRVSLIPLFIDSEKYMKNYFFELKVEHDNSEIYKFVTANDFQIYPLKSEIQKKIDSLDEESDLEEIVSLLDENNPENYDLKNPLSQKKKRFTIKTIRF